MMARSKSLAPELHQMNYKDRFRHSDLEWRSQMAPKISNVEERGQPAFNPGGLDMHKKHRV